jgi:Mce-associated membrane protein
VEVASGRSGAEPVTPAAGSRVRLNLALYVLALLLACGCVFGGVLVHQAHRDRERQAAEQERYGDVLTAARDEMEAFINIDYRNAQESIDAVVAGATGDFRDRYDTSTDGVVRVLERNRSVMDGRVLWAGVVDLDADRATVIVATSGTVANVSTDDEPVARSFRIKVDLVDRDGSWLTTDVEFVR